MDVSFGFRFLAIAALNLVLSADNGLVIALSIDRAPRSLRARILIASVVCIFVSQTAVTLFADRLLAIRFLRLGGGLAILWVALKVCRRVAGPTPSNTPEHVSVWQTVWLVVLANAAVSADNALAIAGVAHGDVGLLVAGLASSIPLVVCASDLLARLLARWRVVTTAAAALLAVIGADMIMTDRALLAMDVGLRQRCVVEGVAAACILVIGKHLQLRHGTLHSRHTTVAGPKRERGTKGQQPWTTFTLLRAGCAFRPTRSDGETPRARRQKRSGRCGASNSPT
jgi:YjbE family integral membrane protein